MVLFTAMNLAGAKFLSESNVDRRHLEDGRAVPRRRASSPRCSSSPANFHAGGGFMPFGFHGVFAALTGGVVFALQGFEQAVQLAGEARDPKKDLSRAILDRDGDRRGALHAAPGRDDRRASSRRNIVERLGEAARHRPVRLRRVVHARARASAPAGSRRCCIIDAVISPAGTGVVYVGTTARLSYALGEEREMPSALAHDQRARACRWCRSSSRRSIGSLAFGPFKSWSALVNVVTGATAIMYAFAPVSLAALHKVDAGPAARVPRADAAGSCCRRRSARPT